MSTDNDNNGWDWQNQGYGIGGNSNTERSNGIIRGGSKNGGHQSYELDDTTTPIRACGNLAYQAPNNGEVNSKDLEHFNEPLSQGKRRRMLHFETETVDAPLFNDEMFLRSEETSNDLEYAISDLSKWVAGFADDTPSSGNEDLDPEVWISDCFSDPDQQFLNQDIASQQPDAQAEEIADVCNAPPQHNASNSAQKLPVHTHQNVVLRGKKSFMRTPPKTASSVAYPFTFIKPCSSTTHGVMTLKDINRRILTPSGPKQDEQDPNGSLQKSPFSGKPVVGKTRIRTEGGEGSITILRTKG